MKQQSPAEARTQKGILKYLDKLRTISQVNRKTPTEAEEAFWKMVLSRDKTGYRFLRQKPIGRYILDFYCPKLVLGIEIDGSSHNNKANSDLEREKYLLDRGVKIIRYTNDEVQEQIDTVIEDVRERIKDRASKICL